MKSYLLVIPFLLPLIFFPVNTAAQENLLIISNSVNYEYAKNILFLAELDPSLSINQINLIIISEEDQININIQLEINSNNKITFNYQPQISGDFSKFNFVNYYYVAELKDGNFAQSEIYSFLYFDNQSDWKNYEDDSHFNLYWIEGELSFAKEIIQSANQSIWHLDQYIDLPEITETTTIIAYPNSSELRAALSLENQNWLAGHARPQNDLVLISVAPGIEQQTEIDRLITHEIAHLRIFQMSQYQYLKLPLWFNEGTASLAELERNPEYQKILQAAYQNNQLLSFSSICTIFPANPSQLALAYAQSDSFMRYLFNQFGKEGITKLLQTYIEGDSCLNGVSSSFGNSLSLLESNWREITFQENQDEIAIKTFLPFLYLLGLISFPLVIIILLKTVNDKQENRNNNA